MTKVSLQVKHKHIEDVTAHPAINTRNINKLMLISLSEILHEEREIEIEISLSCAIFQIWYI